MQIKKHIPNLFSLLNLFSGCIALVYASKWNFEMAFFFVCLGIFFDYFDGMLARLLKVEGPLGVELDSLADMVTCGVVPGFVMYSMFIVTSYKDSTGYLGYLSVIGFIITLGSCYRLAKFNIDTRQTDSFIGLPTPANTLFIVSLALIEENFIVDILLNPFVLTGISLLSAYLLNAEIPLFALKIKKFNLANNKIQIVFAILSVILIAIFKIIGIPLVIILYILMSVINNKLSFSK